MQWDCGFDSPYNSILVHVLLVEARNICSATERSSISHRNKLLMELAVHRHCRVVVKFSNTFRESEGEASYLRKRLLCRSPPLRTRILLQRNSTLPLSSLSYLSLATYILCKFEYITSPGEAHLHLQVLISKVFTFLGKPHDFFSRANSTIIIDASG